MHRKEIGKKSETKMEKTSIVRKRLTYANALLVVFLGFLIVLLKSLTRKPTRKIPLRISQSILRITNNRIQISLWCMNEDIELTIAVTVHEM